MIRWLLARIVGTAEWWRAPLTRREKRQLRKWLREDNRPTFP